MNNSDMPAMPNTNPETYPTPCAINYGYGLTKREHFAGLAMQGLLANQLIVDGIAQNDMQWIVEKVVSLTDALLAELDKSK
tara:strand:- start:41 stop:283 length:243 start_codon:yes stop_codon:yes gene_type:complete